VLLRFDHCYVTHPAGLREASCFENVHNFLKGLAPIIPNPSQPDFQRSTSVRNTLSGHLTKESGWQANFLAFTNVSASVPKKNYIVDFVFDFEMDTCPNKHRVVLEVCFDNRQAIGTNLLKLDKAVSDFVSKQGREAEAILVCADRRTLDFGGWDSGVADEEEYQIALSQGYKSYLKAPISLMVLRVGAK
jgi:hypothetical protein